jgi:hypothetical protein
MFKSPFVNTAFNFTKRQFKRWPVVEAHDLLDYSVADKYADKYPYVWLKNKNINIRDDFDWSWIPPEPEQNIVHCFCKALENKRPVDWSVLKLVSTDSSMRTTEKKQPLIASWETNSTFIVFYTFKKKVVAKKYNDFAKRYPNTKLVQDADSVIDVILKISKNTNYETYYIVNMDLEIDANFDFTYVPENDLVNYFRVNHYSNSHAYEDGSIICFNKNCLNNIHRSNSNLKKHTTVKSVVAGTLNDYQNPEDCWINAYTTSIKLNSNFIKPKVHKNKILTELISNNFNRLDDYLKDGAEQGLVDYEQYGELLLDEINSYEYLKNKFRERQQHRQDQILNPRATAARLKALHGENSDEYLNALKSI